MPFIWDDNQYFLKDDEDTWDKSRFVIARKLFVTPNKEDAESMVRANRHDMTLESV